MARGLANNEPIVSFAQSKAFDEGFDRIQRSAHASERGRFIWDESQGKLVRAEDYRPPAAKDAPFRVGRFYENTCTVDGVDISTRAKREEYMRKNGLADPSDFKQHLKRKRAERDRFFATGNATPEDDRRAAQVTERVLGRAVEQRQKDYDRERAQREKARIQRGRGFEV